MEVGSELVGTICLRQEQFEVLENEMDGLFVKWWREGKEWEGASFNIKVNKQWRLWHNRLFYLCLRDLSQGKGGSWNHLIPAFINI